MRVHTSDSHKERSPSGQCAAISIPREGKLSQAKRERYLRKRKSLSLSPSLSPRCRGIVVTAIASERGSRKRTEMQLLLPRRSSTVFLLPQENPRRRSIDRARRDRSILPNETHSGFTDPTGGSFLVGRMSFSLFPLSPFYRRPLYLVMKGIMKGSRSLRPPFPSPRGIPSLFVSPLRSTLFVRPPGSPPVAGSVYINVWGQS